MQKITPFLWFDGQAEEAAKFYVSVFRNSKINDVNRMGPDGGILTVSFEIEGQDFVALNGGPQYKFTPALSLYVDCQDQREVDDLWAKLTANGGEESRCGWLVDKFGVSWQIIPRTLIELMNDKDPVKAGRVVEAMLQMSKIDVKTLEQAYHG